MKKARLASVIDEMAPLYLAVFWILVGGSIAGLVHLTKAKLRLASTVFTGGVANPVVSVAEDTGALVVSLGAIVVPLVVFAVVVIALVGLCVAVFRLRHHLPGRARRLTQSAP